MVDALIRFAASDLFVAAVPIVLWVWWFARDGVRAAVAAGCAAVLAVAISGLIGDVWYRPRPFVVQHVAPLIAHTADASFPSDHAAALAAIAIVVWQVSRRAGLVAALVTLVVGAARVAAGVHWVTDILGGFALGISCGWVLWSLSARLAGAFDRLDTLAMSLHLRPRPSPQRPE